MKKLQTIHFAARLRQETHLSAICRNCNRWSSSLLMIERYLAIKDNLPSQYPEVADLVPTAREINFLTNMYNFALKEFQAAATCLQDEQCSLLGPSLII